MVQRISARRARIQEQQARKRVVWSLVFAAVLGLAFLFLIVPLLFRFVLVMSRNDQQLFAPEDTFPPQTPAFQPLESHLNETDIQLVAYTEPEAIVYFIVNESEQGKQTADGEGKVEFSTTLPEGEHVYYLYAEDAAGNTSSDTRKETIVVDTTTPLLDIEHPEDGQVFTLPRERTIEIRGKLSEEGVVRVNSSRVTTDAEGNFTTRLQLGEGGNELKFVGEDLAGNVTDEQVRKVEYLP